MAKKNKIQSKPIVKANKSVAALLFAHKFSSDNIDKVSSALNSNGQIKSVFVVGSNENTKELVSKISSKEIIELSGTSRSEDLEKINEIECDNILLINNDFSSSLNFATSKSSTQLADNNTIYFAGNKPQDKENKKSLGMPGRVMFEACTQMCTPISAKGSHSGIAIFSKEVFSKLAEDNDLADFNNFYRFALRAGHNDVQMDSIGQFADVKVKGVFLKLFKSNGVSIGEKLKYYIKDPLHQMKSKEVKSKGANHPIFRMIFFSLTLLSLVIIPLLSTNYAITWDEKLHKDYSADAIKYFTSFGEDETIFSEDKRMYYSMKYYGASFDIFTAAVHKVFPSIDIYSLRHFFNALIGVFTFIFCGLIAKEFGGWRAAVIAFLLIVFSPSYFGHIMNNPKDIPFATGFAMGVLYLIRYFKQLPRPQLATKLYLVLGISFAISIRPPGFILIAFFAFFLFVHWAMFLKGKEKKSKFFSYLWAFISISAVSYVLGLLLWPFGLQDPVNNPIAALKELSNFSLLTFYELFEGVRIYLKPSNYIPKSIAITAPLVVLTGFALSVFGFFAFKTKQKKTLLFLLFFVTIFPIAYAIYKESYVYNGWRHFLFAYVTIASLAAIGFNQLLETFKKKTAQYVVYGILAIGVIKVAFWQIKNHPYDYLYFNEIVGGLEGAAGDYETDYWCQTPRAAIEWLAENEIKGDKQVVVMTNNEVAAMQHYASKYSDSIRIGWAREYEWNNSHWDYAIWTTRTLSKNQIEGKYWPPKGTIKEIKVDGVTIAAVVKRENTFLYEGFALLKENKFREALIPLTKAFEYDPFEEEAARALAMAYKNIGNNSEAIIYFQKALELRKDNYNAYEGIGEIKMYQGEMENQKGNRKQGTIYLNEAKAYFQKAIDHKTNFTSAYYYLGNIELNQGYYKQAIVNLTKVIERNPNLVQGYYGLAKAQIELSKYEEAITNLNYAIQLNANFKEAYMLMADAYKRAGNPQAAQQVMSKMPK